MTKRLGNQLVLLFVALLLALVACGGQGQTLCGTAKTSLDNRNQDKAASAAKSADIAVRKLRLDNGTRVLFVQMPSAVTATVLVLYDAGSLLENPEQAGIAHFVEHMMFRGTTRRPTQADLTSEMEGLGADFNGYTSTDHVGYYIRAEASGFGQGMDILADMLMNSVVRAEDMEIERGAITDEINMRRDHVGIRNEEALDHLMFPLDGLGRPVVGTAETVGAITRADLVSFWKRNFVPSSTIVTVAGRFDEAATLTMLERTFGSAAPVERRRPRFASPVFIPGPHVLMDRKDDATQVSLRLGFPAYARGDSRGPALGILATVLGGGMSSRLFSEIRTKRGLAYSISAGPSTFRHTGQLVIRAGLDTKRLAEAIQVIVSELVRLKTEPVSAAELAKVKSCLRGDLALSLEKSDEVAQYYGLQLLLEGRTWTIAERFAAYDAVTPTQVQAVAADLLSASRAYLAVVSPLDDSAPYLPLLQQLGE
ncbi:MAG: pitrilysin family protein [Patescibacteria group bacterium]|nr:pitrilysin family protein [Patescibacteria group bacterium]